MKIALICPSNMLYMPYVRNYERILINTNVDYDIINWDRFNIEGESKLTYRDSKIGHQRNFLDYYQFKRFVLKRLKSNKYDKVIVFGIQLSYFIKNYLSSKIKGDYVIDIRDYNKIVNYFRMDNLIRNSAFTVLSSPGFYEWLPKSDKYIINHNTQTNSLDELRKVDNRLKDKECIYINYIGSIRDYEINVNFINSLKNRENINLNYHGDGVINKDIEKYLVDNNIKNVKLTGRYKKENEQQLYINTDFINVLIPNNSINSRTLLPNRLYSAVVYGKPVIAFKDTYLANKIRKYRLGIVIDSFQEVEEKIHNYIKTFNADDYNDGRTSFFKEVINENDSFLALMKKHIKE